MNSADLSISETNLFIEKLNAHLARSAKATDSTFSDFQVGVRKVRDPLSTSKPPETITIDPKVTVERNHVLNVLARAGYRSCYFWEDKGNLALHLDWQS